MTLVLWSGGLFSQITPVVALEMYSSGNRHGTFISPMMGCRRACSEFYAGPMIQKRGMRLNGIKLMYSLNVSGLKTYRLMKEAGLTPSLQLIELRYHAYLQYNGRAQMSYWAVKEQQQESRHYDTDWNTVSISTIEVGNGIELRVNFGRFSWRVTAGVALHYHPYYDDRLVESRFANSLHLGTAVLFRIPQRS